MLFTHTKNGNEGKYDPGHLDFVMFSSYSNILQPLCIAFMYVAFHVIEEGGGSGFGIMGVLFSLCFYKVNKIKYLLPNFAFYFNVIFIKN